MPTYGYRCPVCGHEFDKMQKMSDTSLAPCPECGAESERQISGGAGFVFKGTGFYETDYKRASEPKPKTDDSSKSAETSSPDKKVETKPEKKDAKPSLPTPKPSKGSDS